MGLTVGSWNIADVRVQGVTLRPVIGGFELVFGLDLAVNAHAGDGVRRVSIVGARVTVRPGEDEPQVLGFARPEGPLEVICRSSSSRATPTLHLPVQPGQIAALEALRGTGDLDFAFLASGTGADEDGEQHVQGDWRVGVSRSDWIEQLRSAGARNVMLLEVPLPLGGDSGHWQDFETALRRAEELYRSGDYHGCIGACRTAVEELGLRRYGNGRWADKALDRLASSDRKKMSKDEREAALCAVLRHYTHQAHHGPGEGGVPAYARTEAQFVLSVTAAAAAHAQAG